jgi:hypothetical protein
MQRDLIETAESEVPSQEVSSTEARGGTLTDMQSLAAQSKSLIDTRDRVIVQSSVEIQLNSGSERLG